jgi:ankyrin repeat protein
MHVGSPMIARDATPVRVEFLSDTPDTRLLTAARHFTLAKVLLALDEGANLLAYDACDDERTDALLKAASSTQGPAVAEFLIEQGIDKIDRQHLESTLLHRLVVSNWPTLLDLVLRRRQAVDAPDRIGETALMKAVSQSRHEALTVLLRHDASLDTRDGAGRTALHRCSCPVIAGMLVDAGADIEALSAGNETPLLTACDNDRGEMVEVLVARGADLDAQAFRRNGNSAILTAAKLGRPNALLALLNAGADPTLRNEDGQNVADLVAGHQATEAAYKSWRARGAMRLASQRNTTPSTKI